VKIRITKLTVVPDDKPIFDDGATDVELIDEGGGEFLIVRQVSSGDGQIRLDPSEWPTVREAIDRMMKEVKP
jgi:hypothetical protein